MEKELQIINEQEVLGKEFKMYGDMENPLFLAKDVAEWIDYSTDKVGQMLSKIDDEEKVVSPIFYSGQVRSMYFLTEDGVYEVLMQSRKPIAKKFKKEVKKILKQIRQTGGYIPIREEDSEAEIMARALLIAQNTLGKKDKIIGNQRKEIEEKDNKIKEDKPLVDFATQVVKTSDNIAMSQFAKVIKDENIKLGRNKLFEWLRNNTYLRANNEPYQRYIDMNIFVTTEKVIRTPYGDKLTFQTFITPKGQIYLVEKLRKEFCLECNNKNIA